MSVTYIPSTATLVNIVNTTNTIVFPPASEIQGRVLTVKDVNGTADTNPITISTQGTNRFDGNTNIYTITNPFDAITFVSRGDSWLKTATTGSATGGSGGGLTVNQLTSTTRGLGTANYASTSYIYAPAGINIKFPPINVPSVLIQDWSTSVSSVALFTSNTSNYATLLTNTTSNYYLNTFINVSSIVASTVNGLGTSAYVSTSLVYIPNTFTYNTLPFPQVGIYPLSTVSSLYGTFSTLTSINAYIGGSPNQTSINFYGLQGTYDGTVLSERLISTGTQEFFIFKGSSVGENIRLQASGSIAFETGALPTIYSSSMTQSTPTFLITSSRTIGVNCNAPSYTMDISGSANITGSATIGGAATVSGILTSRARVVASTITTNQTLQVTDTGTLFFYTTFTPSLNIYLPLPAAAGSGWNVVIQNVPSSLQVIFVQTPTPQMLSRGNTVKLYTDGISWYFI